MDRTKLKQLLRNVVVTVVIVVVLAAVSELLKKDGSVASDTAPELSASDAGGGLVVEDAPPAQPQQSEPQTAGQDAAEPEPEPVQYEQKYYFRSRKLLDQHYEKHGIDMGFASAEQYESAADAVVQNPEALHKTEKEDGDDVYYLEKTNEFVVVSTDGYIRTYFCPDSGLAYFNRQ